MNDCDSIQFVVCEVLQFLSGLKFWITWLPVRPFLLCDACGPFTLSVVCSAVSGVLLALWAPGVRVCFLSL